MKQSNRHAQTPEQIKKREDRMRPSKVLGYDHESLGMYLITIGSLDLAERALRRAVWLNPYEPRFMKNLALCLVKKGALQEARDWISRALEAKPEDGENREILAMIEERARPSGPEE